MADDALIGVVVLNFNGMADTRECLDSLAPCVSDRFEVLLVDNGSSEPLDSDLHSRWPWLHVERNAVNMGYAGGNNIGLRWAIARGVDWVVLLNNDTTVSKAFDVECRRAASLAEVRDVSLWGPLIAFMDEPAVLMTEGVIFNRRGYPGFFERQEVPAGSPRLLMPTDIVNGCCLAIRRTALQRVGLIDESLFLVHEESDLCLRMAEAGLVCAVFNRTLVWHKGSSAFKRSGRSAQRYYDSRNLLWLLLRRDIGRRGRGMLMSLAVYGRYVWHRYAYELEQHEDATARAVLEGLHDGLLGRGGPRTARWRPGVAVLHRVLGRLARWRWRHGAGATA